MANQVTASITLVGFNFNPITSFPATLNGFPGPVPNAQILTMFITSSTTASSGPVATSVPPGPRTFILSMISGGVLTTTPADGQVVGTFTLTFNDAANTTTSGSLIYNADSNTISGATPQVVLACLHGSSLIETKEGVKRLDQIKNDDQVLTADNVYAKVESVAQCWLTFMGSDHDAIIFEKGSLGPDEPSQELIIDPGHPMCTLNEYLEKGYQALRPAGTYWEELKGEGQIYTKKWTDVFVQKELSVRYDLILEEPHNTYIANGIIVRSKGYKDHRYKDLV
jgi:hypothetical protein